VSFRVIFSLENTPAAVSEDLRRKAEGYLAAASGLRLDRRNPSVEFWFLLRREGAFFMRRLSRHRPWDKLLHPGELPPPLAWMLCKLSAPRNGERVADPFCGYGSIPEARLRHFPPAEFFASDIDRDALKAARAKFRGEAQHHCVFNRCDARELSRLIPPASLDSIITDPPWGFYRDLPAGDLYHQSMKTFSGLLKPGGRIVLLCGRGEEARRAAAGNGFTVARHIPILLSGRKAAIYVLRTGTGGTGRQACRAPRMGAGGTR
jgi:23S rRNA G2445 N2-methylase RlmL